MSDSVGLSTGSRVTIVDHILEQGQRLRNAMVKSILDNDPLYVDKFDSVSSCQFSSDYRQAKSSRRAGDAMSGEYFDQQCSCQVCTRYRKLGLLEPQYFCDNSKHHQKVPSLNLHEEKEKNENLSEQITKSIQECYRAKAKEYFKYVNSLKIVIHSLILNQAGNRKASHSSADLKYKVPVSSNHSYFVEYSVPDFLVNSQQKTGSKVDTGLSGNLFRICSKKLYNEEIYFKHSSIHDIVSLLDLNLQEVDLKFQVSSRTMKQKTTNILGYATFKLSSFEITKHLSCAQNFPIISDGLVMGAIKISFQLGCGRMYFGKEFVELVLNNTKIEPIPSQRSDSQISFDETPVSEKVAAPKEKVVAGKVDLVNEKSSGYVTSQPESNRSFQNLKNRMKNKKNLSDVRPSLNFNRGEALTKENKTIQDTAITKDQNKILLYGLLYISEVNYFGSPINSYLSCQAFSHDETLCSRVVYNNKNPVFNYFQKVPFLFNDDFLTYMRDNSIVVEFWERTDEDVEFGISQLSLHQFYFAYKDHLIAETLFENRLPVTISDWWEPICSPVDGVIQGQMKVIVSVGTQTQIQNLEIERGLRNDTNSVTYIPFASKTEVPKTPDAKESAKKLNNQNHPKAFKRPGYLVRAQAKSKQTAQVTTTPKDLRSTSPKNKLKTEIKRIDVGVQSDIEMEPQRNPPQKETNENLNQNNSNQHQMQDMLQNLLSQLMPEKKTKIVENATNTEETNQIEKMVIEENLAKLDQSKVATNTQLRKTSDLLDSLKDAFKLHRTFPPKLANDLNVFKAHVIIEGALHLPCKRRSKLRKYKRKNLPQEETLPSTYVTYETVPGANLKVTPVVLKSTSPHWDFRSDVLLPGEMLTNSQKRFIFKIWRKNNSNVNEPNLQTDVVLGFAALDLTVLLAGLPGIQGWFNIVDFSSKCNGQIKINVTPLENISRFNKTPSPVTNETENNFVKKQSAEILPTANKPPQEEPSELLGRALKRKFTELEEITQRLRSRLADVTNNDSEESNDEFADEFEKDINNLCVEDDYNMIDLLNFTPKEQLNSQYQSLLQEVDVNTNSREGELTLSEFVSRKTPMYGDLVQHNESFAKSSNDSAYFSTHTDRFRKPLVVDTSSSSGTLTDSESQPLLLESPGGALTNSDMHLIAGRQRIHNLLEKLTLLTNLEENRHVSGCSVSNKTNESGKSFGSDSDRRLNLEDILNPALFNQLCSFDSTPSATEPNLANVQNFESNSNLAQFSNFRYAPEGAGNNIEGASNFRKDN